jgi:hypothetical protein
MYGTTRTLPAGVVRLPPNAVPSSQTDDGASLRPAGNSLAELEAFQGVLGLVMRHDGEGYSVHIAQEQ